MPATNAFVLPWAAIRIAGQSLFFQKTKRLMHETPLGRKIPRFVDPLTTKGPYKDFNKPPTNAPNKNTVPYHISFILDRHLRACDRKEPSSVRRHK
jgi:hypothetical protein